MSDYQDDNQPDEQGEDRNIRNLREKARQADTLAGEVERMRAQLAEAERERAFFKAGIDTTDSRLSYFVKGYDGELTVDAIKAEAERAGFLNTAPQSPSVPDTHLEAFDRIGNAGTGGEAFPANTGFETELAELARSGRHTPEAIEALALKHGQPVANVGPQSGFGGSVIR